MFHKILVAMDSSAIGNHVFNQALSLAKALNARLMLLHVLSSESDDARLMLRQVLSAEEEDSLVNPDFSNLNYYPGLRDDIMESYRTQWYAFESQCLELLQACADEAIAAGVSTEFAQLLGSPGRTVCKSARMWGADLIVMGRRNFPNLNELSLGSVSNYVLHHTPCSVLTVQYPVKTSTQS